VVQLGVTRLLANPAVMGRDAMTLAAAWRQVELLLEDERAEFIHEPFAIKPGIATFLNLPVA